MDFNDLTLQEMKYLYTAKAGELETLMESYWAGAPEDLEHEPSFKEQMRVLGKEVQELERLIELRKSQFSDSPPTE